MSGLGELNMESNNGWDVVQSSGFDIEKLIAFFNNHPSEGSIISFICSYYGTLVPISWPQGFVLLIHPEDEDFDNSMNWNIASQLCCPEKLIHFGFIIDNPNSQSYRPIDISIFVGLDSGAIYGCCPHPNSKICRLAENIGNFFKTGLRRYYDVYLNPSVEVKFFLQSGPNIDELRQGRSLITFAYINNKIGYKMEYPENYFLYFNYGDAKRMQLIAHPYSTWSGLFHVAKFGPWCDDIQNIKVIGRIYTTIHENEYFVRDEDTGDLVFLTRAKWCFLYLGIRPFVDNFTYIRSNILYPKVLCHRCGQKKYNDKYNNRLQIVKDDVDVYDEQRFDPETPIYIGNRSFLYRYSEISAIRSRIRSEV
ncbi:hypothetical protein MRV_0019 [Murid herpesvirus 3]|uniref:Tegument protein n=2 Tax=Murid betaherpesvirus 3 TaxID=2560603 RepID=A0A1P8VIP9_9BETA|nr:hypothetical protein MRV_0019 [Murine roseolovirus]APZ76230.1 hypothetical protein MRV_0019 [Murid betaherpesvirus 3]AYH64751.1 hypothetical protein MRV_0019 [Murid herpesvirus 3]